MNVNWIGLNKVNKHVYLGIVEKPESLLVFFGGILVGVDKVLVRFNESVPFIFDEIHNLLFIIKPAFCLYIYNFPTQKLIITDDQ